MLAYPAGRHSTSLMVALGVGMRVLIMQIALTLRRELLFKIQMYSYESAGLSPNQQTLYFLACIIAYAKQNVKGLWAGNKAE